MEQALQAERALADRASLVARWLDLTRRQLPEVAARNGWPIRLDHCFMRVCLDAACGQPWHEIVARPAIHTIAPERLARAIAVAERILADPRQLPDLNLASLRMRGKASHERFTP